MSRTVDVVVIGAGAAGLAAGRALGASGLTSVVLEADARVGGRAHTEIMPDGAPFDLGCHWMHSASLNPFVETADALGVRYERREGYGRSGFFRQGAWVEDVEVAAAFRAMNERQKSVADAWSQGLDQSVFDTVERDGPWTEVFDFYDTLNTSSDVDQISIGDLVSYNEYFGWYYSRFIADQTGVSERTIRQLMLELMPNVTLASAFDKPMFISEFGAGAKAGMRGEGVWTEDYQADVYRAQFKMISNSPQVQGMTPWILKDFRAMLRSLGGVQDFRNRKGLIDENGRRKQAFYVLRDFYAGDWANN